MQFSQTKARIFLNAGVFDLENHVTSAVILRFHLKFIYLYSKPTFHFGYGAY